MNKKISENTKKAMAKLTAEQKLNMYTKRDSCDGRRWMHKNGWHIRAKQHQILALLGDGWIEGRIIKRDIAGQFTK
jgi:hypothetical protein